MATDTLVLAVRLVGAATITDERESTDLRRNPRGGRAGSVPVVGDAMAETMTAATAGATLGATPSMS